jgi:DNA repair exonuclease SbcCD ATPase subunit
MKIKKVALDGMGCFSGDGRSFDFDSNRIVVLGPNEAGKSTLMRSISALLFGFDNSAEASRWKPWGKYRRFGGQIHFDIDGKQYVLDRDWEGDYVKLTCDNQILYDSEVSRGKTGESFRQLLSEILPLSRAEFFRSLSFIRQEELLTDITIDLRERITGSGKADALKVLDALHEKYHDITWEKSPWGVKRHKMRIMEELANEIKTKRAKRTQALEATRKGSHTESQLQEVEQKLTDAENNYRTVKQVLTQLENFSQLLEKETQAKTQVQKLREERERVEKFDNTVNSLQIDIDDEYADLETMPPDTGDLIRTYFEKEAKERELGLELQSKQKRLQEIDTEGKLNWWRHVVLPMGLSVILTGLLGYVLGKALLGVILGFVLGIVITWTWTIFRNKVGLDKLNVWQEEVDRLSHQLEILTNDLNRLRIQLSPIIDPKEPTQSFRRWEAYLKLKQELGDSEKRLEGNRPVETIINEHEDAQTEYLVQVKQVEEAVKTNPYLIPYHKNPGDLALEVERRRHEEKSFATEIDNLKKLREKLRLDWTSQVAVGIDDTESLELEIQNLEKQLTDLQRQKQALLLASECLEEAIAEMRDEHRGDIEKRFNELFRTWTGHLERSVKLDKEWNPLIDLNVIPAKAGIQNSIVNPELLSRGTQDQLYLAYRVALSEALSRDIPLPFLLDDPFVHFDPERRKLAQQAFEAISEHHQVILFTQDPSFQNWGKVIKLSSH